MVLFQQKLGWQHERITTKTLRYWMFVTAGALVNHARKRVLQSASPARPVEFESPQTTQSNPYCMVTAQRIFGSLVSRTDDSDGDGRSNYEEYLAGTDPKDPNSRLTIATFAPLSGGGLTLTWDTVSGETYTVERSTSLTPDPWSIQQADIQGDGTQKSITDNNPGTAPRHFCQIGISD